MFRNNYSTQKPENVLKRVDELIASSTVNTAERNKKIALEQLHTVISSKRKQWQKSLFEPIVKRHLELCVDLKDHRTAKDGLHQYRNMVQSVDPSSLETIILYLMDLAETRANDARKKSNKVALAAAAKISDLDQEETPESIMLSTMTVDGVKDRTDREVVVPWLKFLWETYRAILELLHKNAKLDKVYLKTCEKALAFCLDYQRTLEFRRLCEMLRMQLSNLQKLAQQPVRVNRPGWEWTPESIEIHLQIRFNQLEVATTLEQWNEAFRTVEDIYSIMQLGKKTPKPRLMATYYEKLTRIFWVSENYLFHAYAWYRFYSLSCEYRKDIKPEEKSLFASSVLLATLCIPTITDDGVSSGPSPNGMFDDEEIRQEKNQQMALLLDFQANPSRSALLTEIMTKGLLNEVYPELKQLYESMETGFKPLQMIQTIVPVLDFVSASPQISMYRQDLQKIAIVVCTRQLSSVYSTVKIDFLKKLFAPLNIPYVDVEKVLVDALTRNQLNMRVDHLSGCFRFGTTVNIAPVVERQLATTGLRLKEVADKISSQVVDQSVLAAKRKVYLTAIELASRNQHASVIERKMAIERRKEGLERLQRERIDQEDRRKSVEEAVRREEETKRLKNEEEMRNQAKLKTLQDKLQVQRVLKTLENLGVKVDENTLKAMDEKARKELVTQAQLEAQKNREEEAKRLSDQARLLDYITRALRIEQAPLIVKNYEDQLELDRKEWEYRVAEFIRIKRCEHEQLLKDKERLARTHAVRGAFENDTTRAQREKYEKEAAKLRKKAWEDHRNRKVARARYRKDEEDERLEEEAEAERERQQRLEYERLQAEQHEELRKKREQEMLELEERRAAEEAEKEKLKAAEASAEEGRETTTSWRKTETPSQEDDRGSVGRWGGDRDGGDRDTRGGSRWGGDRDGGDRDSRGGSRWGGDRDGGDRDTRGGSRWGGDRDGGDRDTRGGSRWGGDRDGGDRDTRGGSRWGGDRDSGDRDTRGGGRWGGDRDGDDRDTRGGGRWGGDRDSGRRAGPPASSGPPARSDRDSTPSDESGVDGWRTVPKTSRAPSDASGGWRKR